MKLDFIGTGLFINASPKKVECPKEQKLVDTATKLMLDHDWLDIRDSNCGCDDEFEYYSHLFYDFDVVSRAEISEEWKLIKKEAIKLCK